MFQKYIIVGRLTQDADLRYTQGGDPVTNFRVITSKKVNTKEHTFAIDATLWGKLGESLAKYLKKGQLVLVEGELRQESWQGRDNQTHYKTSLVADTVRLLGGKREEQAAQAAPQQTPAQQSQQVQQQAPAQQAQPVQQPQSNDPFEMDW
ncbi:single-stranded DNA-binding protein [Alcanivorax sp.]|uniref:single-stranded DNA-binding protein n=1 Tax=Alcanivorax sp. TaxID=1872427 RepID=UPI0025878736|nr:single-stranded DNA-binding protein [Alcanivorax sp.]